MIRGIHGLFFSSDPKATREFLRDKVKLPSTDIGDGWLIFDFEEGDLGVHPVRDSGQPGVGTHFLSFHCDDIHGTIAEMESRGVKFDQKVEDRGFGWVTTFTMPGGVDVQLYEPKYNKRGPAKARKVNPTSNPPKKRASKRGRRVRRGV